MNMENACFWLNLPKEMVICLSGRKVTDGFLASSYTAELMTITLGQPDLVLRFGRWWCCWHRWPGKGFCQRQFASDAAVNHLNATLNMISIRITGSLFLIITHSQLALTLIRVKVMEFPQKLMCLSKADNTNMNI